MKLLFEIDKKDYDENGTCFVRPSARGIIIKNGKIAMIHSLKYDYYKFPGGGIEQKEEPVNALIREVKEEAGLMVIPSSIKEYGMVRRMQKGEKEDIFIQENFYYLCDVENEISEQNLDDYEEEEAFTLEYVTPEFAIDVNRNAKRDLGENEAFYSVMIEREMLVLETLLPMKLL